MLHPTDVLHALLTMPPQRTADAPADRRGIYGLIDHAGRLSYIGCVAVPSESFRKRIHHRHRTGSETHSHYFSKVYCTGRMWRDRLTQRGDPDAKAAKDLRSAFIAQHCRAVWVPIDDAVQSIPTLETAVIRLAPPEAKRWNANTGLIYDEPVELVDATIEAMGMTADQQAALERQRMQFEDRCYRTSAA